MKRRRRNTALKEWHRTIFLIALLAFAIAFVIWTKNQYSTNFVDTF